MSERPRYEPPPPIPPMSPQTGDRVAVALGLATPFIGVATMAIEHLTGRTLAAAIGSPTFLATPLGIAALVFIPIVARVGRNAAVVQTAFASIFWLFWFHWSFP